MTQTLLPGTPARPERSAPSGLGHVRALDGVRGIAVLLVVAYHFGVPVLDGGFLGVDLFFVLSGFLITTLLLQEHRSTGRVDLVRFWLRRARRLLPAMFALVLVVALAAPLTDPVARASLRGDLIASMLYVVNWRFIAQGQSYFAEYAGASPLRHLWSLAIEEQFYLFWPIVVGACLLLVHRCGRAGRRAVLGGWAALTLGSVTVMALLYDAVDPSRSYYGTDARAQELLVGAGLAVLLAARGRTEGLRLTSGPAGRAAAGAGVAGAAAVAVMAVTTSDTASFYYTGGSLLFAVAGAALIVGSLGPDGPLTRGLSWRPLVWVGQVSYGLYLWHWPMAVWLTPESTGLDGVPLFLLRSALAVTVTALSFYLVERPVRRGRVGGVELAPRVVFPAIVAVVVALSSLTMVTTRGAASTEDYETDDFAVRVDGAGGGSSVAVVGDSVARSLYDAVAGEAGQRGWTAAGAVFGSCSVGDLLHVDSAGKPFEVSQECVDTVPLRQDELVGATDPDVVLWYSGRDRYDVEVDGAVLTAGSPEWRAAKFADWDRTLGRLTASGARVVLVLPVWTVDTPPECETGSLQRPDDCPSADYISNEVLRDYYVEWAGQHPDQVDVYDLAEIVCPDGPPCPAEVDGLELRYDRVHYSDEAAAWVAPRLLDRVPALQRLDG